MRYIGIRQLRAELAQNIKDLPIVVTNRGQAVAVIVSADFFDYLTSTGVGMSDAGVTSQEG